MEVAASSKACGPPPATPPVFGTSHPATAQIQLPAVPANDALEFEYCGCLGQFIIKDTGPDARNIVL